MDGISPDLKAQLTPTRIGTIVSLAPADSSAGHDVSIRIEADRTLSSGDILCVGIPVPESADPPIFSVQRMMQHGRSLREVAGPGTVMFTVPSLSSLMCLNAPVCRIIFGTRR